MQTGVMAMSYCESVISQSLSTLAPSYASDCPFSSYTSGWRYACLPDSFASAQFNATVTLSRWNIARMPGGATFNTSIKATQGVNVAVSGPPKSTSDSPISFNGTGYYNVGNITLPPSGIKNLTFTWTVPVGFDDLSAAIEMHAWPGPPPPSPPPAPPGTVCGCAPAPVNGACADGTTPSSVFVTGNASIPAYLQCIPSPQYDIFAGFFAFSTCYQWACFPPAFKGKPFTLSVLNITQYNIDLIPGGISQVLISGLKPYLGNTTVTLHPATNVSASIGPFTADAQVTLPDDGLSSIDIVISIPALPWLDVNSVAVEIHPGAQPPAPPAPPAPPPRPPSPPLPPVPPNTTVLIANFVLLQYINNQTMLNTLLNATSAAISAQLAGYLLTMPTAFAVSSFRVLAVGVWRLRFWWLRLCRLAVRRLFITSLNMSALLPCCVSRLMMPCCVASPGLFQCHGLYRCVSTGLHQQPCCSSQDVTYQLHLILLLWLCERQQQAEKRKSTAAGWHDY